MVNTKRILLFCLTKQKQNNRTHKKNNKKMWDIQKQRAERNVRNCVFRRVAHAGIYSWNIINTYMYVLIHIYAY